MRINPYDEDRVPLWMCPGCGACIGYIGRFFQWLGLSPHSCTDPEDDCDDETESEEDDEE